MRDSELPVVIIGAGPYGLSVAAHLHAMRVDFRIFGQPMQSWREHMPRGMLLKSEGFASQIYDPENSFTLGQYCRSMGLRYSDVGEPVPLETFVGYGLEFQSRLVPGLERQKIREVRPESKRFTVITSSGETLKARYVVVATGITYFDYLPPEMAGHSPDLVSHSSAHSDLSGFRGRSVAVVGGGSSAIDIAALLHEAGAEVHVLARRRSINFHEPTVEPRPLVQRILAPRSGLGLGWRSRLCTDAPLLFHLMPQSFRLRVVKRHLGPAPGWFMKERVEGRVPIHLGMHIDDLKVSDRGVHLRVRDNSGEKRSLDVSHVICATGYKPVIRRLPYLGDAVVQRIAIAEEAPILNRQFECSVPGMFWVGLASANSFGPLARFAFGARFTAMRLGRHIASSLRVEVPPALVSHS